MVYGWCLVVGPGQFFVCGPLHAHRIAHIRVADIVMRVAYLANVPIDGENERLPLKWKITKKNIAAPSFFTDR